MEFRRKTASARCKLAGMVRQVFDPGGQESHYPWEAHIIRGEVNAHPAIMSLASHQRPKGGQLGVKQPSCFSTVDCRK